MCVSASSICVFFSGVVAAPLILQLFEYSFNATMCSMVKQLFYFRLLLILCILLNHRVDIGVLVLLLSSSMVGCHGTTPRFFFVCFHKCLQIHYYEFVNNIFANICESVIIGVQLDQKYLV